MSISVVNRHYLISGVFQELLEEAFTCVTLDELNRQLTQRFAQSALFILPGLQKPFLLLNSKENMWVPEAQKDLASYVQFGYQGPTYRKHEILQPIREHLEAWAHSADAKEHHHRFVCIYTTDVKVDGMLECLQLGGLIAVSQANQEEIAACSRLQETARKLVFSTKPFDPFEL